MREGRWSSRLIGCAIATCLVAGCATPAAPTENPVLGAVATLEPSTEAIASPGPSPSPMADPVMTDPPTAAPIIAPTPNPTKPPKPSPTLNWENNGFSASVRSPVSIGAKAKVTLKGPLGPTCTLKVRYPSGTNASLPSPTHPEPNWWTWTWTIPAKAHAGTATGTATCTYAGVPKSGPISFKIVDPALPGGWAIDVTGPASRSSTDTGLLSMTVHVKGTVPSDANYGVLVTCNIELWSAQGPYVVNVYSGEQEYVNGSGQFVADFDVGELGPYFVGKATWTVKCRNIRVQGDAWKPDTGTIDIT